MEKGGRGGGGRGEEKSEKKIARSTKAKILLSLRNAIKKMYDVRNPMKKSGSRNLYNPTTTSRVLPPG